MRTLTTLVESSHNQLTLLNAFTTPKRIAERFSWTMNIIPTNAKLVQSSSDFEDDCLETPWEKLKTEDDDKNNTKERMQQHNNSTRRQNNNQTRKFFTATLQQQLRHWPLVQIVVGLRMQASIWKSFRSNTPVQLLTAQVHHLTEWWKTCKTDGDDDGPATMSTKRSAREERRLDRLILSTTI
jgi:hypothetical protein